MGLLLTYLFQVQASPYGQPIEFWPRLPASSMIYTLGLSTIFAQAFSGLVASFIFKMPLLSEGFVGTPLRPYDFDKLPMEGEVGEDRSPLILRKYDPLPAQSYEDAMAAGLKEKEEEEEKKEDEGGETVKVHVAIPRIRRNNTKAYNVLSVSEARMIQKFVRRVFFFKLALLGISIFAAVAIVVSAKNGRDEIIDDVKEFLSQ